MKIAFLSESPADEAAIRVLTEAVLGQSIEVHAPLKLRARGWPSVLNLLHAVISSLQYETDVDGLVVIVDSNGTPLHKQEKPIPCDPHCRLCTLSQLRPRAGQASIRVAIGLAMPAIEAWYLCGKYQDVGECLSAEQMAENRLRTTRKRLKVRAYGTDVLPMQLLTQKAVEYSNGLAASLAMLEARFPIGFGGFAAQIKSWR
jgi:hypothetical protein